MRSWLVNSEKCYEKFLKFSEKESNKLLVLLLWNTSNFNITFNKSQ